jgi:hypothetical protein
MPHFPLSSRIGFISEREAEILTEHFSKPGKTAMPHELAGKTSITYAEAMSLLFL